MPTPIQNTPTLAAMDVQEAAGSLVRALDAQGHMPQDLGSLLSELASDNLANEIASLVALYPRLGDTLTKRLGAL